MTSIYLPEADPLKTRCPICFAYRGEPCVGGEGRSHSAREALRIAEIETTRTRIQRAQTRMAGSLWADTER